MLIIVFINYIPGVFTIFNIRCFINNLRLNLNNTCMYATYATCYICVLRVAGQFPKSFSVPLTPIIFCIRFTFC